MLHSPNADDLGISSDEDEEEDQQEPEAPPQEDEPQFQRIDTRIPDSMVSRSALAIRIAQEIDGYHMTVARRRDASQVWRYAYETMPPGTANRWDNSSDSPSPFTRIYADSHTYRLNGQILDDVPPYSTIAEDDDKEADQYSDVIGDCLWSMLNSADWIGFARKIHKEISVTGNCLVRTTYEQKIERHPRVVVNYNKNKARQHLSKTGRPDHAVWAGVEGVKLEHETVTAYQGICLKVIPWEDMFILPPTAREPEEAYGIGEIYSIRGEDLVLGVKQGIYDEDAVEMVMAAQSDDVSQERRERLDAQGLSDSYSARGTYGGDDDRLYRQYRVAELCWKADFDGDGLMEWAVVVMHMDTRKILRLSWLEYEHGQPYYTMMRYMVRPGEMFAMGVAELISSFHNADTAVLNQLIDHGDLALNWNGNIFYDDTAGLFPDRFVMQLGKPIRVQNLGGIKPVPPMALPAEHYQMHLHLQDICDRLTATSNISLGKPAESESTLGEMQMVNSSLQRVFEDHVAEVARQHVKIWDQVRWLVSQYGVGPDGEVKFRSTVPANENVFKSIPPDILRRRVQFVPTGLKQMSDMGTRVQIAVMIRNAMLGDPLVQSNVEAKMMLADDYLRALNYPHREELMGAIKKGVEAQQQVQQAEMASGGGQPLLGGPGGDSGGAVQPPAGAPAMPSPGPGKSIGAPGPPPPKSGGGPPGMMGQ